MPTYKVSILANNEAGTWQSWNEKIAAIRAFYASVCTLDITLVPSTLTPQFTPYEPSSGNGTVYRVAEDWYEANVLPLAPGADIVMFVVPPTDHPNVVTLMGLDYYQQGKQGETTVFSDETSHTYVGEADQGETAVVYAEHELSHHFYGLLAKTDNTHLYFFAGTPQKVLADFDFQEAQLPLYQQVIQDLEQQLGLLKARQVAPTGDPAPAQPANPAPAAPQPPTPAPASFPPKITSWAAIISKEEGANPANHNPGNLAYSTLTASWGATKGPAKTDGGNLAVFPDDNAGLTALCNFLVLGCEDGLAAFHAPAARTLAGFTVVYAGNPPQGYIDAIVEAMGVPGNYPIAAFIQ